MVPCLLPRTLWLLVPQLISSWALKTTSFLPNHYSKWLPFPPSSASALTTHCTTLSSSICRNFTQINRQCLFLLFTFLIFSKLLTFPRLSTAAIYTVDLNSFVSHRNCNNNIHDSFHFLDLFITDILSQARHVAAYSHSFRDLVLRATLSIHPSATDLSFVSPVWGVTAWIIRKKKYCFIPRVFLHYI